MCRTCTHVLLAIFLVGIGAAAQSNPSNPSVADLLQRLDQLMQQNQKLEQQNQQLLAEIVELRQALAARTPNPSDSSPGSSTTAIANAPAAAVQADPPPPPPPGPQSPVPAQPVANQTAQWGTYTPNLGFRLANTENGDLNVSIYSYVRYLNQRALEPTYENAFGVLSNIQQRQDVQLSKVQFKFLGWIFSPKMRYFLYAWTSNALQGEGAQVVLGGNLNYTFNSHLTFGGGIYSLPGTRSLEGNFPSWLGVDTRLVADEFFRPSYTSGLQARGDLTGRLRYQAMIADNTSQLGVAAAQLPNFFSTFSGALVWTPTTGEFGSGFGDFETHPKLATRLALHYSRSRETKQSQPATDAIDNTQIRLSDGSIVFTPGLFGPGIDVNEVRWRMATVDGGLKYHGYSLEAEYFERWLDQWSGPGTAGLPLLFDHGYQAQASAMVIPKQLQLYAGQSWIFGKYGQPYDARTGVNFFPWKNRGVRWNTEVLFLYHSPVGYTSVPFAVGGTGFVFHSNLEMAF